MATTPGAHRPKPRKIKVEIGTHLHLTINLYVSPQALKLLTVLIGGGGGLWALLQR